MCAHIKSCLRKFFNKIKFSKRANLFDGKLCLSKKNKIFNLFCPYFSTSKISICEKVKKKGNLYIYLFFPFSQSIHDNWD